MGVWHMIFAGTIRATFSWGFWGIGVKLLTPHGGHLGQLVVMQLADCLAYPIKKFQSLLLRIRLFGRYVGFYCIV